MNPTIQDLMAQIIIGLPIPPPPIEPLKMEVTMQIYEEMEKRQREVAKGIVEEPECHFKDDYF